eukprot:7177621-Pyramimonas_sp.AAC.1
MSTWKKNNVECFEKCLQKLPLSTLSTLTRERSPTSFPAVTRLTVHRRRQFALCSPGFGRY